MFPDVSFQRVAVVTLTSLALLAATASVVTAQALADVCPGADAETGGLVGSVADDMSGVVMPGASVSAEWTADGQPVRADVQSGFDGTYALCHLPMGVEMTVVAFFGDLTGSPVVVTLTDPVARQDLTLSLAGGGGDDSGDRLIMCPDLDMPRLLNCSPSWPDLQKCPREEHGQVRATRTGVGGDWLRELIEDLIVEVERQGGNAVLNAVFNQSRSGGISGLAVTIDVDPATC